MLDVPLIVKGNGASLTGCNELDPYSTYYASFTTIAFGC